MIPIKPTYDGVGNWFRDFPLIGESAEIWIGTREGESASVHWFPDVRHSSFDGVGAFIHLLRKNGYPELAAIPKPVKPRRIGLWQRLSMSFSHLWRVAFVKRQWSLPLAQSSGAQAGQPPRTRLFLPDETAEILAGAREAGVTVNTVLLEALSRATREALGRPASAIPWMIPVNMRGGVEMPTDTMNHASFIDVEVHPGRDLAELQAEVNRKIEEGWHWWFWHFSQIVASIAPLRRVLLRLQARSNHPWIGSFSNLGRWELAPSGAHSGWLFAPPVTRFQPIGAGAVTSYGRLGLALQIHPSVDAEGCLAERILEGWVAALSRNSPGRLAKN